MQTERESTGNKWDYLTTTGPIFTHLKKKQTHIFKSRCEQTRPVHEELRHSEEHRTLLQKLKTLIFLKTRLWVEIILCF